MLSHVASTSHAIHVTLELYDSRGYQTHDPLQGGTDELHLIMPKPINVAINTPFTPSQQGNLPIHVPNGKVIHNITSMMSYTPPDIVFTLVSMVLIDEAGMHSHLQRWHLHHT